MSVKAFREPKTETIHADLNSADETVGHYYFLDLGSAVVKYYRPVGRFINGFVAPAPERWMRISMA